jgi:hypothetical protein
LGPFCFIFKGWMNLGISWKLFIKIFMGATSKGLMFYLFHPFFVWAHLRDLFESFFGHILKLLGKCLDYGRSPSVVWMNLFCVVCDCDVVDFLFIFNYYFNHYNVWWMAKAMNLNIKLQMWNILWCIVVHSLAFFFNVYDWILVYYVVWPKVVKWLIVNLYAWFSKESMLDVVGIVYSQ